MKKIILAFVLLISAFVGYKFFQESKSNIVITEAKAEKSFNSLDEMNSYSPLIVIGTKTNEKTIIDRDDEGYMNYFFTLSDFKINKVFKNKTGKVIEKDGNIIILETEAKDDKSDQLFSVSGYQLMEKQNQYLLFLEPNSSEDKSFANTFNIEGVVDGKFSFQKDKNKRDEIDKRETSEYEKDALNNHRKMYNELNHKYSY